MNEEINFKNYLIPPMQRHTMETNPRIIAKIFKKDYCLLCSILSNNLFNLKCSDNSDRFFLTQTPFFVNEIAVR